MFITCSIYRGRFPTILVLYGSLAVFIIGKLFANEFQLMSYHKHVVMKLLIFYILQHGIAALIVVLARIVPGNALFCSHTDFLRTVLDSPTAYCTISGLFLLVFLMIT